MYLDFFQGYATSKRICKLFRAKNQRDKDGKSKSIFGKSTSNFVTKDPKIVEKGLQKRFKF